MMSLTRTLILLNTAMTLIIVTLASTWSYWQSSHELEELFDAELAQNTRIVEGLVRHLAENRSRQELQHTLSETLDPLALTADTSEPEERWFESREDEILSGGLGHRYEKKISFQVWTETGQPILPNKFGDVDTLAPDKTGFGWLSQSDYRWRTFTLHDEKNGFWIRSVQREDIREELSGHLALGNVLPIAFALPLFIVATLWAVRTSFRPLRHLQSIAARLGPGTDRFLPSNTVPQEVEGLVTALNQLLTRLNRTIERERRFSSDAAHELRTPLAALRLQLESISQDSPTVVNELLQSLDRMAHLVDQMLVLSKADSDFNEHPERLSLSEWVAQSVADVYPLAQEKQIELQLLETDGEAWIMGNPTLINTMIRSLLANAIQYGPESSEVTLTLSLTRGGYQLKICDHGPGIPEEERNKALSRFVRLDQRQGSGAGLGLAIAQRITERHGGILTLEERSDRRTGLCAAVWLPSSPT